MAVHGPLHAIPAVAYFSVLEHGLVKFDVGSREVKRVELSESERAGRKKELWDVLVALDCLNLQVSEHLQSKVGDAAGFEEVLQQHEEQIKIACDAVRSCVYGDERAIVGRGWEMIVRSVSTEDVRLCCLLRGLPVILVATFCRPRFEKALPREVFLNWNAEISNSIERHRAAIKRLSGSKRPPTQDSRLHASFWQHAQQALIELESHWAGVFFFPECEDLEGDSFPPEPETILVLPADFCGQTTKSANKQR